jgi:ribosomal 50S subunit-recycling heat shock protein
MSCLRNNILIFTIMFILFAGTIIMEYEYSEEEAELYRIDIEQVTPDSGITTGHVIAYGHYIKPPYKIEVNDTFVYVNNVQVFPVLITEGEKRRREEEKRIVAENKKKREELRKKVESDPELMQLIRKASKAYINSDKDGDMEYEAAADVFRNHPRVEEVKVYGNFICVFFKGIEEGYELLRRDLDPSLKKTPEEIEKLKKQEEEMRSEFLKDLYKQAEEEGYPPNSYGLSLRAAHGKANFLTKLVDRGSGIIIETNSTETIGEKTVVFIVLVLREPYLSETEKTYILRSKWYMHNYDPSEWPSLQEIKNTWKNGREYIKIAENRIRILKEETKEFIEKLEKAKEELYNEN